MDNLKEAIRQMNEGNATMCQVSLTIEAAEKFLSLLEFGEGFDPRFKRQVEVILEACGYKCTS